MKTSDRTLLASMAFADPDRAPARAGRHDMAIRYLMQPDVGLAVWRRFARPSVHLLHLQGPSFVEAVAGEPERIVKAASGFVVGFADLVLEPSLALVPVSPNGDAYHQDRTNAWAGPVRHEVQPLPAGVNYGLGGERMCCRVVVEVKVALDDPGAAVRQLKLYAEHLGARPVLAVVDPVSGDASAIVKSAGIGLAQLGPKFREFLAASRDAEPDLEL